MKQIPESELVLNDDGSIYHLHLLPEEIAETIILVGDQDRVPEVSKHFDRLELSRNKREFVTHTGYIGSTRISVVSTGIGTDNIDIVMNELDALVNIDLRTRTVKAQHTSLKFIRIGTSGSLQADLPVDTILASSHALGLDSLLHFYPLPLSAEEQAMQQAIRGQLAIEFINPYFVQAPGTLIDRFPGMVRGITATCCGFYAPQGRMLRSNMNVPDLIARLNRVQHDSHRITNFEMETAGIYGMAKLLGHEAVSINALLANRITHHFSTQPQATVNKAIEQVLSGIV